MAENSYGWCKRLAFVGDAIADAAPANVLDIGCGTGTALTLPLAEAYPGTAFLGVDTDAPSIRQALQTPHPPNLRFSDVEPAPARQFDLVIASEVLEHVEDPAGFTARLRSFVRPGGRVVVTVPNGYGPFEAFALLEALLNLSGAQRILRAIKRRGRSALMPAASPPITLSVSPHVNFFSRRALLRLFDGAGLRLRRFRPNTFLCGYLLDSMVRSPRVAEWNARIADRLPAAFSSDWMFELEPCDVAAAPPAPPWHRNGWGRWRRALNLRRWGLA